MATAAEVADALDRLWNGEELRAADVPAAPVLLIRAIRLLPDEGVFRGDPYVGQPTARFEVTFTLDGQPGRYLFEHPFIDLEQYEQPEEAARFLGSIAILSPLMQWWSGKDLGELGPHLIEDQKQTWPAVSSGS
jgi:hypothetical protein